jgi:hypothetical protein
MKLFEIEIGRNYKCDRKGGQYVATVKEKQDGRIGSPSIARLRAAVVPARSRTPVGSFGLNRKIFTRCRLSTLLRLLPSPASRGLACRNGERLK